MSNTSASLGRELWLPVAPQGKERARKGNGHFYTPERTKSFETEVKWLLKQERARAVERGWLDVYATFLLPKLNGRRSDLDNYVKSLFDACNAIAWTDDFQVTRATVELRPQLDGPKGITFRVGMDNKAERLEPYAKK